MKSLTHSTLRSGLLSTLVAAFSIIAFQGCATGNSDSADSSENTLARTAESADIGSKQKIGTEENNMTEEEKSANTNFNAPAQRTDAEWREILTPEEYHVMRECGTERAFTGKYWNTKTPGVYLCAGCGEQLFDSDEKYESGSGWPSFWKPADSSNIAEVSDNSLGMKRIEIICGRCGAHLGHLFPDGPQPTGLRYCINSISLKLKPDSSTEDKTDSDDN
jgi:peptide-methionine (R)-S-oxide reductase